MNLERHEGFLEIREIRLSEIEAAATVLGRGMRDNPRLVAAFGSDPQRRERILTGFFSSVVAGLLQRGMMLGAFDGTGLQGVCGMARPGECQPRPLERVRILGGLAAAGAFGAGVRLARWAGEWARHDSRDAHWHLGPVAVDPDLRGRGIGRAMLSAFCARMDEAGSVAYLETDKQENVGFYESYGFRVDRESTVAENRNWYMSRPPMSRSSVR